MTHLYRCQIELHDSLYFATREIGRLYETEPILHNYALCYALGLVDSSIHGTTVSEEDSYRYFCDRQVPQYAEHLTILNENGIYVTPARAIAHATVLHTWKYTNNNYHVEMKKTQKNIPSFGRAKEVAPESIFECFILSKQSLLKSQLIPSHRTQWRWKIPKWIRLGKWMSKAEVTLEELKDVRSSSGETHFMFPYPLNPLDVMFTHQVTSYDVINMPPVSLIRNVHLRGHYYSCEELKGLKIPARMEYRFS
ncbi:MAG: type I-D CRISPR-associated protein Cas5/Csc1 [Spirulina sp.]